MPQWTVHLEGGPRRVNHAAVAVGDKIYTFGGYCTGEDYRTTRPMDVHVLNTVSYQWVSIATPAPKKPQWAETPYQRYGHTAVAVGDCAYIFGGRNDVDGACNILFCLNTVTLKWSRPPVCKKFMPGARDGHSACVINNKMYIFGGFEEAVDQFTNDVHELDFATLTWSLLETKGSPPHWRDFHSATGFGNCMYIFGGRGDLSGPYHTSHEVYCNKIQVFNTLTGMWHEPVATGIAPPGRRSHSAFSYKGELYIFGGFNGSNNTHFNDLYKFNPVKNHWSLVRVGSEGPCPRRRQCCCVIGDRAFLFGGSSPRRQSHSVTDLDLMDHSDLYVLDLSPSLCTLCMLVVLKHGLVRSYLPKDIRWELAAMTTNSNISRPLNMSG